MKIQQLIYFVAVCDCGSITEAASQLFITQPSISSAIKELEKMLDVSLFRRVNKRLYITKEGQHLYNRAVTIIADLDTLKGEIKALSSDKNHLKIGLPMQVSSFLLPHLYGDFLTQHPNIDLEILELDSHDLIELLNCGEIDAAILGNSDTQYYLLDYQKLFDSEVYFFTHKDNALAKNKTITIEDIANEPLVLPNKHYYVNASVMKGFAQHNLKPNILMDVATLHTISNMMAHNYASTLLIRETQLRQAWARKIPMEPPLPMQVGLLTSKCEEVNPTVKKLENFLITLYNVEKPN